MLFINRNLLCYLLVLSLYRFFVILVVFKMVNLCLLICVFFVRIVWGGLNCCFCYWFFKRVWFLKCGMYMEELLWSVVIFLSVFFFVGLKLFCYFINWVSFVKLFWCELELFIISWKWFCVVLCIVNILFF